MCQLCREFQYITGILKSVKLSKLASSIGVVIKIDIPNDEGLFVDKISTVTCGMTLKIDRVTTPAMSHVAFSKTDRFL